MAVDRVSRQLVLIAQEAARIVRDEGLDYGAAKRKALKRLGKDDPQLPLPDDELIDSALAELNQIYAGSEDHSERLLQLRRLALRLMREHSDYSPRLAGHAARGYVSQHSPLVLWLFADSPEEIVIRLLDSNGRFKHATAKITTDGGRVEAYPSLRFQADATEIELVMLPTQAFTRFASRRKNANFPLLDEAGIAMWLQRVEQGNRPDGTVATGA